MKGSEGTREHILERAAGVFNRRGYSGASMSEIMEATGLQKGGLYWHFGSKEELALEAFDFAMVRANERLALALEHRVDAIDRVLAVVEVLGEHLVSPTLPGGSALMNTAIESDDGNPALRERARDAMRELLETVEGMIVGGQRRGEVRPDADARAVAVLVVGAAEGALAIARLLEEAAPLELATAQLRQILEARLRP